MRCAAPVSRLCTGTSHLRPLYCWGRNTHTFADGRQADSFDPAIDAASRRPLGPFSGGLPAAPVLQTWSLRLRSCRRSWTRRPWTSCAPRWACARPMSSATTWSTSTTPCSGTSSRPPSDGCAARRQRPGSLRQATRQQASSDVPVRAIMHGDQQPPAPAEQLNASASVTVAGRHSSRRAGYMQDYVGGATLHNISQNRL